MDNEELKEIVEEITNDKPAEGVATDNLPNIDSIKKIISDEIAKIKELENLTEDEKLRKAFDDERATFEAERAEFEHSKLTLKVKTELTNKNLPAELADLITVKGDAAKSLANVGLMESLINDIVNARLKASLRQPAPGAAASGGLNKETNFGAKLAKNKPLNNGPVV